MRQSAIERAVETVGGQTKLAAAIGVSQGLVWQWLAGRTAIDVRHFAPIELATEGKVTSHELLEDEMKKRAANS